MSSGVHRRLGLPVLVVLALTLTACGADADGGDADSAQADSTTLAAPAQQTSIGDLAAPAQSAPAGSSPAGSDDDAASDTGPTASESETAGPAHSVPVPGLKQEYADQIPQETSQVLVATSPDAKSEESRSEEHTSELQSRGHLVCRLLLEKKKLGNIRTVKWEAT